MHTNTNKKLSAVKALIVALSLALAGFGGLATSFVAPAAPVMAEQTDPSILLIIPGTTARTGNYTTTARYFGDYTILNYLGSLAQTDGQTMTAYIQVSADNAIWHNYVTLHNAVGGTSASITPAKTDAVGLYVRALYVPVSSTLSYTPALTLIGK